MRVSVRLTARLGSLIERSPSSGPMVIAGFVGLITVLASVGFEEMIEDVHYLTFDWLLENVLASRDSWRIFIVTAIGGLIGGAFIFFLAREVRGAGVLPVLLELETRGGVCSG
jgi:formate/nitrite transporter FocA (FNT family)